VNGRNALTICAPTADAADCWDLLVEFMSGGNSDGANAIVMNNNNNNIDMVVSPNVNYQQGYAERAAKRVSQGMFNYRCYCFLQLCDISVTERRATRGKSLSGGGITCELTSPVNMNDMNDDCF
jgi:hypothetical protein